MASQRQEEKKLYKGDTERSDEKHKALTRLVRYAGPDIAQKAESLEEVKIDLPSEGGRPPNIGILNYVSDLIKRAEKPFDYCEIANKVVAVFPDHYPPKTWNDPEDRERLGRTLVGRALEHQEKVRPIDEAITKARQEEKALESFIKGNARLRFAKTIPLYEALKRVGAAGILEMFEEA